MALTFLTWIWGDKYSALDVAKLEAGIRRNTQHPFRFIVATNNKMDLPKSIEQIPIEDEKLIGKGCFCRLRMFDPQWQAKYHLDTIVGLDLDLVITANIDGITNSPKSFMILQGVNAVNPNPFNCSLMVLKAGKHREVWDDFSLEKANKIPFHEFPDDQGWIWHKLPRAEGWKPGPVSGIYGFMKPGWPNGVKNFLPANCKIVAFIGKRKPGMFTELPWVRANWRVEI